MPVIISNRIDHFGATSGLEARAGVHGGFLGREPAATDDDQAELEEVTADELLTTVIPITRKGYSPDVIANAPTSCSERSCSPRSGPTRPSPEAQAIAGEIRGDAEASAQLLVADAEQLAAHLVETERIRAHAILDDALACRAVIQGDIAALEEFASQARARLRDTFEAELTGLDRLLAAVSNRPDAHEIDLTDPTRWGAWCGSGTRRADRFRAPELTTRRMRQVSDPRR